MTTTFSFSVLGLLFTPPPPSHNPSFSDEPNTKVLYVANLQGTVTEDDLQELFAEISGLKEIRLVRKKTGQSRGFAYVEYQTEEASKEALKFDKTLLAEHPISVALANPNVPKDSEPLSFG